jgi:hypothetical protein
MSAERWRLACSWSVRPTNLEPTMKISKTPSLLIALTLTSMIAAGCAIDDTETDLETDDGAEIEEPFGETDGGEFEGAATLVRHGCASETCTVRLNRAGTKQAGSVAKLNEIARKGCGLLKNAAAIAYCEDAVTRARELIAKSATIYHKEGDCLGIKYKKYVKGASRALGKPVQVKAKTHNCQ